MGDTLVQNMWGGTTITHDHVTNCNEHPGGFSKKVGSAGWKKIYIQVGYHTAAATNVKNTFPPVESSGHDSNVKPRIRQSKSNGQQDPVYGKRILL